MQRMREYGSGKYIYIYAGRKNGERRLFTSVNLRLEHAALVEEIALETGRTKTQVLGDMVQFAYDHIELYEEGEA